MRKDSKGIFNHVSTKHSDLAIKRLELIPKGKERKFCQANIEQNLFIVVHGQD